jgi:hypothetical protein
MISTSLKPKALILIKILIVLVLVFTCDRIIGIVLRTYYFHQKSGDSYRTTYAIDSTLADVLILGSSRAAHSYIPSIFEDRLHKTCYNTGKDGSFLLYNYAVFKAVTKRYKPKLIIIDFQPEEIDYNIPDYDRLSSLLPYFHTHPEIQSIIELRGPFEKIKRFSSIYPYNSKILQIFMGNVKSDSKSEKEMKGYLPLFRTIKDKEIRTYQIDSSLIDQNKILAIKDIISTCKEKDIKLVFVYSPILSTDIDEYIFRSTFISKLCQESGVVYLDLSNNDIFMKNAGYFADRLHLNNEGAIVFTNMLIDKIYGGN